MPTVTETGSVYNNTEKIHKLLLTVLEIEDYYVDAHCLILNFKNTRTRADPGF